MTVPLRRWLRTTLAAFLEWQRASPQQAPVDLRCCAASVRDRHESLPAQLRRRARIPARPPPPLLRHLHLPVPHPYPVGRHGVRPEPVAVPMPAVDSNSRATPVSSQARLDTNSRHPACPGPMPSLRRQRHPRTSPPSPSIRNAPGLYERPGRRPPAAAAKPRGRNLLGSARRPGTARLFVPAPPAARLRTDRRHGASNSDLPMRDAAILPEARPRAPAETPCCSRRPLLTRRHLARQSLSPWRAPGRRQGAGRSAAGIPIAAPPRVCSEIAVLREPATAWRGRPRGRHSSRRTRPARTAAPQGCGRRRGGLGGTTARLHTLPAAASDPAASRAPTRRGRGGAAWTLGRAATLQDSMPGPLPILLARPRGPLQAGISPCLELPAPRQGRPARCYPASSRHIRGRKQSRSVPGKDKQPSHPSRAVSRPAAPASGRQAVGGGQGARPQ